LATELGSDFAAAGGRAEEVAVAWSHTNAGTAVAADLSFAPERDLAAGDALALALGLPGMLHADDIADVAFPPPSY